MEPPSGDQVGSIPAIREELFEYDYLDEQNVMFASFKERPIFKFYVIGVLAIPVAVSLLSIGLYGISVILANVIHKLQQ